MHLTCVFNRANELDMEEQGMGKENQDKNVQDYYKADCPMGTGMLDHVQAR